MPELPEVEVVRRSLTELVGETLRAVDVSDEMLLADGTSGQFLKDTVPGQEVVDLERVGKYCLVELQNHTLLFSLRMTGTFLVSPPQAPESDSYIRFEAGNRTVWFTSIRRFSTLHLYSTTKLSNIDKVSKLGPDPLRNSLTAQSLAEQFQGRTAPVKTTLMNQEVLAGLGNIYANEVCYETGLDPRTGADLLNETDYEKLSQNIPALLEKAVELGGSSVRDFNDSNGETGDFQEEFYVYRRHGQPCLKCDEEILRLELAGRSTFLCPNCQK